MQTKLENQSGIHPKANKLLVLPEKVEEVTKGGIIVPTQAVEKEQMAHMFGRVVEIGKMCWITELEPRCEIGDYIIHAKYAGEVFKGNDGVTYRLMNATDVIATKDELTKEQDHV